MLTYQTEHEYIVNMANTPGKFVNGRAIDRYKHLQRYNTHPVREFPYQFILSKYHVGLYPKLHCGRLKVRWCGILHIVGRKSWNSNDNDLLVVTVTLMTVVKVRIQSYNWLMSEENSMNIRNAMVLAWNVNIMQ